MNCEEFILAELRVSRPLLKESLRSLLSSILFIRSIGGNVATEPVTRWSELLGLEICDEFELEEIDDTASVLVLSFYVPRQTKKSLWDILSQPFEDKAVFERWKIPVAVVQGMEEEEQIQSARDQVRAGLRNICQKVNQRMDHLPPPPTEQPTYYFEIKCGESQPWRNLGKSIRSIPFIT